MTTIKYSLALLCLAFSGLVEPATRVPVVDKDTVLTVYSKRAQLSEEEREGLLLTSCFDIVANLVKLGIDNPNNPLSTAEKHDLHGLVNSLQMFAHVVVRKYPAFSERARLSTAGLFTD